MISTQEIEQGLAQREFRLHYQPKYSVTRATIAGSEALIRWERPDGSLTMPDEFIGVAERSTLISRIGAHVVGLLMGDMAMLQRAGFAPVSFNLSARDLQDDHLVRLLLDSLAVNQIAPDQVEVEITENQALAHDGSLLSNIKVLRKAGVGLAIDDYGLGYSSPDTLSKWPFTTIKIDQGLIGRMLGSEKNASIVRSAIRLGHELGLDVVAEGVETFEQYSLLAEAGCSKVQGYLISKPLNVRDVAARSGCDNCPAALAVGLVHLAILDHIQWRKKMVSYALRNASLPPTAPARNADPGHPTLSCRECLVGRWSGTEGQAFAHLPQFGDFDAAHRYLHAVGAGIVAKIQAGAGNEDIAPLLASLTQASLKLLEALIALENDGLAMLHWGHSQIARLRQ